MLEFFNSIIFLLIAVVMVIGAFATAASHHAEKLRYGVPWLRWLTFEEIIEIGHSRFWARRILPYFYRHNWVEIRISDQISEAERVYAERRGLYSKTAMFYEYRFTEKWRRGKQKKILLRLPAFGPTPAYNSPPGSFLSSRLTNDAFKYITGDRLRGGYDMSKERRGALDALLRKNVLWLSGKIEDETVGHIYSCLAVLEGRGSPDIEVRIFSIGGRVRAGLNIYDALRRYQGKKTGVVYSYARSMGAVVLQACDERVCLKHAALLIHHIHMESIPFDVLENPRRLQKFRQSMRAEQRALYAILAKRTGRSRQEIYDACKKDHDMSAEEALRFGLIDRIEVEA